MWRLVHALTMKKLQAQEKRVSHSSGPFIATQKETSKGLNEEIVHSLRLLLAARAMQLWS